MLSLENITLRIAGRILIEDSSLILNPKNRYGIFGRNGAGKSTLFKAILGQVNLEQGRIFYPPGYTIGHVAQEAPGGSLTPLQVVLNADLELTDLLNRAETETDPHALGDIYERLTDIDAYTAEGRAAVILKGLGFTEEDQQKPMSAFSGGWRMRVALAQTLFLIPDLLLLDEPTNHLDLEACLWLEEYLKTYPKTLIIISHDRRLLNRSVNNIIYLQGQKLTLYGGNFDTFEKTRREQEMQLASQIKKQTRMREHMQSYVDRFRAQASKARQAQSRLKAIARMDPLPETTEDPSVTLKFPEAAELAPPLITFDNVDVGYEEGKPILKKINLRIDPDDRIALLGSNGNGKSTFAKLIAGRLQPQKGDVFRSGKIRVGFFAQHQIEELNPDQSAFEHFKELFPKETPQKVRSLLGQFGFSGEKADVKCAKLSGGEKARLNLAIISSSKPHMLILDEPTNHLDMPSREALMMAINDFNGAVILISHDAQLLETTMDRLVLIANNAVTPFDGDLDDYTRMVVKGDTKSLSPGGKKEEKQKVNVVRIQQEADKIQVKLEKLQVQLRAVDDVLSDPGLFQSAPDLFHDKAKEKTILEKDIARLEAQWLDLQSQLES